MFQSIKYLHSTYDIKADLYYYHCEIIDSYFISASMQTARKLGVGVWVAIAAAAAIKEYENRKYDHKEIISNLFLLNILVSKGWGYKDINPILEYQHKYLTKQYFTETNFSEKYYDDLVKYTKKMMVIS